LINKDANPFKAFCSNGGQYAIGCSASLGPVFGSDDKKLTDIVIKSDSNTHTLNYFRIGYSYQIPEYPRDSVKALTILAGSVGFQTEEIEVYTKAG